MDESHTAVIQNDWMNQRMVAINQHKPKLFKGGVQIINNYLCINISKEAKFSQHSVVNLHFSSQGAVESFLSIIGMLSES